MKCKLVPLFALDNPTDMATFVRVYNIIIAVLNTIGNSLLIWGLKKTGQCKTMSFHYIIIMSTSDLIAGINCLTLFNLVTWEEYHKICWARLLNQFMLTTCNCFSFFMLVLIAFDRYLHMKYLNRYNEVVTKRRGYLLIVISILFMTTINCIMVLPIGYQKIWFLQYYYVCYGILVSFGVGILYYSAMKTLKANASQLSWDVVIQTRTLSKAAKRISISVIILSLPLMMVQILKVINDHHDLIAASLLNLFTWLAYITFLFNGFCSSFIFMSQNRPLKTLFKQYVTYLCHCVDSSIWPIEANA